MECASLFGASVEGDVLVSITNFQLSEKCNAMGLRARSQRSTQHDESIGARGSKHLLSVFSENFYRQGL